MFGAWARIVVQFTKPIGFIFLAIYILISKLRPSHRLTFVISGFNLMNWAEYHDDKSIWTPVVSQTISQI